MREREPRSITTTGHLSMTRFTPGRSAGGSEPGDRRFGLADHAVPVVHGDQVRALPAQVLWVPVAVPDHRVTGVAAQMIADGCGDAGQPLRFWVGVQVDVAVFGRGPQPWLGVIPAGKGRGWGQVQPLHRGQVARLEQLRRGRRAQPAPAPDSQRVHAHDWAARLGHHPIVPDPRPRCCSCGGGLDELQVRTNVSQVGTPKS